MCESNISFQGCQDSMFLPASMTKRASDPHLKSSICGIAAAPLKAFFFSESGRPAGQNMKAHSTPSFFWVSSLSSIKRKDELKPKGTYEQLFVVANLSLFTEVNGHVDICVFVCVCACLQSVERPVTFLCSFCLSSSTRVFGCLSPPVAQKSFLRSASSPPSAQHTYRKESAEVRSGEN